MYSTTVCTITTTLTLSFPFLDVEARRGGVYVAAVGGRRDCGVAHAAGVQLLREHGPVLRVRPTRRMHRNEEVQDDLRVAMHSQV